MDKKIGTRVGFARKFCIQQVDEPDPARGAYRIIIAQQALCRKLKIVLHHQGAERLEPIPDSGKAHAFRYNVTIQIGLGCVQQRPALNIYRGCVYENDIGLEFNQACLIENSFLKILVVVRKVENRLYALLQQQQLKKSGDLIDRGPAQECDANGKEFRAILQLRPEPLLLWQKNAAPAISN